MSGKQLNALKGKMDQFLLSPEVPSTTGGSKMMTRLFSGLLPRSMIADRHGEKYPEAVYKKP